MKRAGGALLTILAASLLLPVRAIATALPPDVLITEVQTASASSASEEFVELYNNTDSEIDFADAANGGQKVWKIQYFSSTKVTQIGFSWDTTLPTGSISLTGKIPAHEYYLLSTSISGVTYMPGSIEPDQTYASAHFSDTGGGVQLVDETIDTITQHDNVAWSDGIPLLPGLMITPTAGGSLQRNITPEGSYLDETGVLLGFGPSETISPKAAWQEPAPADTPSDTPVIEDSQIDDPADDTPPQITPTNPTTVQITELLPNPASPATDTNDEFVEIHNYGDEPVDLSGFTIQTGTTYSYNYVIPSGVLAPQSYQIFTSGSTPLSLANSGGRARLVDLAGQTISETEGYTEADEGSSWALIDESWQWTTSPTPGAANILTSPLLPAAKSAKKKTTKSTKSTAKKKSVKGAKTSSALGQGQTEAEDTTAQVPPLHPTILAGIGGAALLYGAYEYKADVANRLYQFRKYREARRAARAGASGR